MSFGGSPSKERQAGEIIFHPMKPEEYNLPQNWGGTQVASQMGYRPKHKNYVCGACGNPNTGRVMCDVIRESDGVLVSWCVCSCEKSEPSVLAEKDGVVIAQLPLANEYKVGKNWPPDLASLYEEAAKCYSAGAFTATSLICRKLLMVCAVHEKDGENKSFAEYVDYIVNTVLTFPRAKKSIDAIRNIGNDATHEITFIAQPDAKRSMDIITYMLNSIYSLPGS